MNSQELEKREREIYKKRLDGLTYKAIGKDYNISSERVRQIFNRYEYQIKKEQLLKA